MSSSPAFRDYDEASALPGLPGLTAPVMVKRIKPGWFKKPYWLVGGYGFTEPYWRWAHVTASTREEALVKWGEQFTNIYRFPKQ